jgi:hypothetical protein
MAHDVELTAMDLQQIHNLVYRYCWHVDHGEFDAMGELFAHAEVTLPAGVYSKDPAGLASVFREYVALYEDGTPRTRHVTTNLIIEAEAADRASATSMVTVFQQTDTLALQPVIATRNFDRFEKVGERWRFAARRIEMGLFGHLSAHMKQSVGGAA